MEVLPGLHFLWTVRPASSPASGSPLFGRTFTERRAPTGALSIGRRLPYWREGCHRPLHRPAYFRGGYAMPGPHLVPPYPAGHGRALVGVLTMDWLYPLESGRLLRTARVVAAYHRHRRSALRLRDGSAVALPKTWGGCIMTDRPGA